MAYKIYYGNAQPKRIARRKGRLFVFTVCFFLLFLLTVSCLAPGQMETLRKTLFPQSHVDALLQDLRDGEPLSEAVSAFCQGIFQDD